MALFDFLTGGSAKRNQTKSGPGNAGGGNEEARKRRLAEIEVAKAKNKSASDAAQGASDAAAKEAAEAAKKKNAKKFWGKVLGKSDG